MGGVPAAQRAYRELGERTREGMPGDCGCVWEERPKRSKSCGECDFGAWTGKALADVASQNPSGLDAWLRDPHAAPHGGESLAELINRVGRVLDDQQWPDGRSVAVVTPLVARALLVHALGAAPEVIFRIDIAPLGRALISRSQQTWRLTSLSP